jgi:hypothetical protein
MLVWLCLFSHSVNDLIGSQAEQDTLCLGDVATENQSAFWTCRVSQKCFLFTPQRPSVSRKGDFLYRWGGISWIMVN